MVSAAALSKFCKFLSTPSARRATTAIATEPPRMEEFLSTPSARRATDTGKNHVLARLFLSTPSARRATAAGGYYMPDVAISIHALREEGDAFRSAFSCVEP